MLQRGVLDLGIKLVDETKCLETTAFEDPEDKETGMTDMDNVCCVQQEFATDTQILNSHDVIVTDAQINNSDPRPSVINNDDHNVSVEEIVEDNTKDTDTDCLICGGSLLKHVIKNMKRER